MFTKEEAKHALWAMKEAQNLERYLVEAQEKNA